MIIRTIYHEIQDILWSRKMLLLLVALIIPFFNVIKISASQCLEITLTDLIASIFSGVEIIQKASLYEKVSIPIGWFLIVIICLYLNLCCYGKSTSGSIDKFEIQIMVREKDKRKWLFIKLLEVITNTTIVFIILGAFTIVVWRVIPWRISGLKPTEITAILYKISDSNKHLSMYDILMAAVVGPWITICTMSCIQIILCLFVQPMISLLMMCLLTGASIYLPQPWMIGSGSMAMRSSMVIESGIDFWWMGITCFGVLVISTIIGIQRVKGMDVL